MGQKSLWYSASVRKPVTNTGAAVAFGDDCIRVGDHPGIGQPEWKYEIPFSEVAQIEMRSVKDVLRGTLKDGTEFDIRFKATANLAKQARRPSDMEKALKKIDATSLGGGSIRAVGAASSKSGSNQPDTPRPCATPGCNSPRAQGNFCGTHSPGTAGCLGCFGSAIVVAMPALAVVAFIV